MSDRLPRPRTSVARSSSPVSTPIPQPGTNGHAKPDRAVIPGTTPLPTWNEYKIGDARDLARIFTGQPVVDVTVTSPPYWNAKDYGAKSQIGYGQKLEEYLDDLTKVFTDVWKCTKRSGSLWIIIKSIQKDRQFHLLPFLLSERLTRRPSQSWHLQDVLIWHKTHTLPWTHGHKLTDSFEYILCFSKSKEFSLNIDAVRSTAGITNWWIKYPERYHPQGKSLSNVWEIPIPTQGSWGNGTFAHACPLPVELVKRIILLSTGPRGTVLDPFGGTGTTALAAMELQRKWFLLDTNQRYRTMFDQRRAQELPKSDSKQPRQGRQISIINLALRQLKYAVLLHKRIAPGLRLKPTDVAFMLVLAGKRQKQASPHWIKKAELYLVLDDECHKKRAAEIVAEVNEAQQVPPMSKFQLDFSINVSSKTEFFKSCKNLRSGRLYLYSRGKFWTNVGRRTLKELASEAPVGDLPPIASNIKLNEQPAY